MYLDHWSLFCKAYRILTNKNVTLCDIAIAEKCLQQFYMGVELLYGVTKITIKIHSLVHAADVVRNYGPLQNVSSYLFEDLNGKLVDKNHATFKPIEQLHQRFGNIAFIRSILHSMRDADGQEFHEEHPFVKFLEKDSSWKYNPKDTKLKHGWTHMVGFTESHSIKECCSSKIDETIAKNEKILLDNGFSNSPLTFFMKFKIGKLLFLMHDISVFKSASQYVLFSHEDKIQGGRLVLGFYGKKKYNLIVEVIGKHYRSYRLTGTGTTDTQTFVLTTVESIVDQCIFIQNDDYWCLSPLHSHHYIPQSRTSGPTVLLPVVESYSHDGIATILNNPTHRHSFN